jgi:hypothetical protein
MTPGLIFGKKSRIEYKMFKQCNKCAFQWATRDEFLSDKTIEVVGYQVFFEDLELGLFLFNHSCHTTIAIEADLILDLYDGPIYLERKPGNRKCPGRCLNQNIVSPCSKECRCAFISEIMQIIKKTQDG